MSRVASVPSITWYTPASNDNILNRDSDPTHVVVMLSRTARLVRFGGQYNQNAPTGYRVRLFASMLPKATLNRHAVFLYSDTKKGLFSPGRVMEQMTRSSRDFHKRRPLRSNKPVKHYTSRIRNASSWQVFLKVIVNMRRNGIAMDVIHFSAAIAICAKHKKAERLYSCFVK